MDDWMSIFDLKLPFFWLQLQSSLSSFIKFPIDEESEELYEELERKHRKSNNCLYSRRFFLWDYKPGAVSRVNVIFMLLQPLGRK